MAEQPVDPANEAPVVPDCTEMACAFSPELALEGWNEILTAPVSDTPENDDSYYVAVAIYIDPAFDEWKVAIEEDEEASPEELALADSYSDYTVLVEYNALKINGQTMDSMVATGFCIAPDESSDEEGEEEEDGDETDGDDGEPEETVVQADPADPQDPAEPVVELPFDFRFDKGDNILVSLISYTGGPSIIIGEGKLVNGPELEDDENDAAISNFAMASVATIASLIAATSF